MQKQLIYFKSRAFSYTLVFFFPAVYSPLPPPPLEADTTPPPTPPTETKETPLPSSESSTSSTSPDVTATETSGREISAGEWLISQQSEGQVPEVLLQGIAGIHILRKNIERSEMKLVKGLCKKNSSYCLITLGLILYTENC